MNAAKHFAPAAALVAAMLALAGVTAATAPPTPSNIDRKAVERLRDPPLGLPPLPEEAAMPTARQIALGRKLFFDRRLSRNGTMSCAMCHIPEQGFTNNELATPVGVEGRSLRRNAPTILNVAYQERLFHDGREPALETQALAPLIERSEMANPSLGAVIERIESLPDYDGLFEAAFGSGPTVDSLGRAIAAWERSMISGDSPFDRWYFGGDEEALTPRQIRGYELFVGEAGCVQCHTIGETHALFTDQAYHNTGIGYARDVLARRRTEPVPVEIAPGVRLPVPREAIESVGNPPLPDRGRLEVTERPADLWRFKTPSLRDVALTAPYMHDGSFHTLEEVVRHYNRGGVPHDSLDPLIRPLGLDDREIDALVAFLEALTGDNVAELVWDARSAGIGN